MPNFNRIAMASADVVGSGTVGPDPMTDGSSSGTSEIISVTTRAGAAASASRPPLIEDRCLRTQFISPIGAPLRKSARLIACFSSKVMPGAGSASSADAPPDSRHSTRSSGPSPEASSMIRRAASRPAASGTGCAASTTSIRRHGAVCPYRVTTRPSIGPDQWASTAAAIAAAAFPAPTTTVLPFGTSGRYLGTQSAGEAAATAESNISRSSLQ